MSLPPVPKWLQRLILRWQENDCYKIGLRIALLGQDNGNAQMFLNAAKDNLYLAAREFDLMKDRIL